MLIFEEEGLMLRLSRVKVGPKTNRRFGLLLASLAVGKSKCLVKPSVSPRKCGNPKTPPKTRFLTMRLRQFIAINMSNSLETGDTSSDYYYFPHVTKQDYDQAFNAARLWALDHPEEASTTAARIYHVKELALRKSVCWLRQKQRNTQGVYNT
jgi:hypothetical protein